MECIFLNYLIIGFKIGLRCLWKLQLALLLRNSDKFKFKLVGP